MAAQATPGPSPHTGENLVWIHKPDLLKAHNVEKSMGLHDNCLLNDPIRSRNQPSCIDLAF